MDSQVSIFRVKSYEQVFNVKLRPYPSVPKIRETCSLMYAYPPTKRHRAKSHKITI